MALMRKGVGSTLRFYQATFTAIRYKSEETAGKGKLPHYIEHSTGLERKELLARAAGNTDPFGMNVVKRGAGSRDNPNLVPSFEEKRIIGCICDEDSTTINWMWVHRDDPKRCGCGHWFKIVEATPL